MMNTIEVMVMNECDERGLHLHTHQTTTMFCTMCVHAASLPAAFHSTASQNRPVLPCLYT
jgi:hypothetical protein